MKAKSKEETTNRRTKLNSLFSASALLLSVVCCIALFHVELKIQEYHRVLSQSATFCDQMEKEILQKVQQNYERWQINKDRNPEGTWHEAQGKEISFELQGENFLIWPTILNALGGTDLEWGIFFVCIARVF